MKKFAQILNGKLHWKFEQAERPEFSSEIHIVEITGVTPDPVEGWLWVGGKFTPPIVNKSELEKLARLRRDALISNSDWTQLPDIPLELSENFKVYRQSLRDITNQPTFPELINWPVLPQYPARRP